MSVIGAFGDSNAAPDSTNQDANTGPDSAGMLGYTQMPFPKQMPAQSNADITTTKDFGFTEVNQGTSLPSYDEQDEKVSAETGNGDDQETSGK